MPDPLEFGIVIQTEDGRIERFLEKPTWGQVFSDTVNTGIYVMEPEVFAHVGGPRVGGPGLPLLLVGERHRPQREDLVDLQAVEQVARALRGDRGWS